MSGELKAGDSGEKEDSCCVLEPLVADHISFMIWTVAEGLTKKNSRFMPGICDGLTEWIRKRGQYRSTGGAFSFPAVVGNETERKLANLDGQTTTAITRKHTRLVFAQYPLVFVTVPHDTTPN
jgi:hypothetical protein